MEITILLCKCENCILCSSSENETIKVFEMYLFKHLLRTVSLIMKAELAKKICSIKKNTQKLGHIMGQMYEICRPKQSFVEINQLVRGFEGPGGLIIDSRWLNDWKRFVFVKLYDLLYTAYIAYLFVLFLWWQTYRVRFWFTGCILMVPRFLSWGFIKYGRCSRVLILNCCMYKSFNLLSGSNPDMS